MSPLSPSTLTSAPKNRDDSGNISLKKPDFSEEARASEAVRAYLSRAGTIKIFIDNHLSFGKAEPYPIESNPIPEFLNVTEELLARYENSEEILLAMGEILRVLWRHSHFPHGDPNRAILTVIDKGISIDLADNWDLPGVGITKMVYMFLAQKNHTSDSLSHLGPHLGELLNDGLGLGRVTEAVAKDLVKAYEDALAGLPRHTSQSLYANYFFDTIRHASKEWSYKKERVFKYFESLIESNATIDSPALSLVTTHLTRHIDLPLGRLLIELNGRVLSPTEHSKNYAVSRLAEWILESKILSSEEKDQLIKEAELRIGGKVKAGS